MKIVVDMNLTRDWLPELHAMGHEAIHWSAVGAVDAPDMAIMEWARINDHIVMTSDLDFAELLAVGGGEKPSVIQLRLGRHIPMKIAGLLASALIKSEFELATGALLSLDHKSNRLRLLPLKTSG